MDISVIIPVFNEEQNIKILYNRLRNVLTNTKKDYEILFINDGSTDSTYNLLEKIQQEDKRVRVISFQRNFGKASALSAGFEMANGTDIITMDGDLQDDPDEIPNFLSAIKHSDLVVGWKFNRQDSIGKRLSSKVFNLLTRILTKTKLHDMNCGFKIFRKNVAKNLKIHGELHRYIPVLAQWEGFKVNEIKVNHHPRKFGKSKYGSSRLFKGFLDLLTVKFLMKYGGRPLHLFGLMGGGCFLLGFIIGAYMVYLKLLGEGIGQRPLLILSVLLIVLGIQFFSIGLIGEMIRMMSKSKGYLIKNEKE